MSEDGESLFSHKSIESSVIFLCFMLFGAASAGLGAAFPQIGNDISNDGTLKYAVLGRGAGFLSGLLCNLYVISRGNVSHFVWIMLGLCTFSSCFTFAMAFVAELSYYEVWLVVFPFLQGVGFASCDALGNQFLLEKWRDVHDGSNGIGQSWVHKVHAGFTGGGLIGPLMVGALGYKLGFMLLGLSVLIPFALLCASSLRNGSPISRCTPSTAPPPPPDNFGKRLNPWIVRGVVVWFFFLMGQEIVFSSWISSYVVDSGISNSDAKAAYASSAFYAAMLAGRLAMGMSSTLRNTANAVLLKGFVHFQLVASVLLLLFAVSWKQLLGIDGENGGVYWLLIVLIIIFGLSVNSLIGMGINMIEDYSCLRWESNLIVKEIIGLSIGEVVLPVLAGVVLNETGPFTLMVSMLLMAVCISAIYFWVKHLIVNCPEAKWSERIDGGQEDGRDNKIKERLLSGDA